MAQGATQVIPGVARRAAYEETVRGHRSRGDENHSRRVKHFLRYRSFASPNMGRLSTLIKGTIAIGGFCIWVRRRQL
ncbi:hypothetical protein Z043_117502 [Scleropages formosus]|uniref:Uncharacterized protein n=1 Tax=Scleropages formosus TaxID=113540 RepID=A0A0P7UW54_SCLFO|nr:hypothetical protein Z043_117502 [Scleropages formosus]